MDNKAFVIEVDNKESDSKRNGESSSPVRAVYTFEDAISLTGVGKFQYILLLICGFCFMTVMCEIMGVSIIMPSLKCDLPSTVSEQGILASAGFFGVVMSSHAMGFLADTCGRVRTLRYSLILSTIATFISAFSGNIWMLIVFRFLNGFFVSGGQACVFSLCGEFHGNKTRVRHVTLLAVFLPLAFMYLPSMAMLILPIRIDAMLFGMKFSSWRLLLMGNCVISLLALVGLFCLPETPKYMLVQGNHDGALEILRKIYVYNNGGSADDYPVKSIVLQTGGASIANIHGFKDAVKMIWHQTVPLFYRERFLHTLNICFCLFIAYGISQGIFMWFPTILNELVDKNSLRLEVCTVISEMKTKSELTVNICAGELDVFMFQVLIMIGGAFTATYFIFAFTIDYIGKKNLLIGWLVLSASCSIAIHWITEFSVTIVMLTLIMSVGNCGGIISTIAMEFYPTNINAMGMCFIMMIGRLGAVAGSNIIGQVLFQHCDLVFWVLLGIICLLSVMCFCLPDRKNERKKKAIEICK